MIKQDDTVFCIKDYSVKKKKFFKKGQRYKIVSVYDGVASIDCTPSGYYICTVEFTLKQFIRKKMTGLCRICPFAYSCESSGGPFYNKFFTSLTEERRIKLEKIKKSQ